MLILSAVLINIILLIIKYANNDSYEGLSIFLLCTEVLFLLDALVNRFIVNADSPDEQTVFLSPPRLLSQAALITVLLISAINEKSGFSFRHSYYNMTTFLFMTIAMLICAAVFAAASFIPFKRDYFKRSESALLYVITGLAIHFFGSNTWILSNILLLGLGIYYIILGGKKLRLSRLNLGMLLVMYIIILRFFDLDLGLLQRGITFIILGIAFFICNILMFRKRKGKAK